MMTITFLIGFCFSFFLNFLLFFLLFFFYNYYSFFLFPPNRCKGVYVNARGSVGGCVKGSGGNEREGGRRKEKKNETQKKHKKVEGSEGRVQRRCRIPS